MSLKRMWNKPNRSMDFFFVSRANGNLNVYWINICSFCFSGFCIYHNGCNRDCFSRFELINKAINKNQTAFSIIEIHWLPNAFNWLNFFVFSSNQLNIAIQIEHVVYRQTRIHFKRLKSLFQWRWFLPLNFE